MPNQGRVLRNCKMQKIMIHERHEKHKKNGLAKGASKYFWPIFLTAAIDSIVS
jgi:hypothetical protein